MSAQFGSLSCVAALLVILIFETGGGGQAQSLIPLGMFPEISITPIDCYILFGSPSKGFTYGDDIDVKWQADLCAFMGNYTHLTIWGDAT
jgi:hypothetical protein